MWKLTLKDGERELWPESLLYLRKLCSSIVRKTYGSHKGTNLNGAGTGSGTGRGWGSWYLISTVNLGTNFAECFGHVLSNMV